MREKELELVTDKGVIRMAGLASGGWEFTAASRKRDRSKCLICIYSAFQPSHFLSPADEHLFSKSPALSVHFIRGGHGIIILLKQNVPAQGSDLTNSGSPPGSISIWGLGGSRDPCAWISSSFQPKNRDNARQCPDCSVRAVHSPFVDAERTCSSFGLIFRMDFL